MASIFIVLSKFVPTLRDVPDYPEVELDNSIVVDNAGVVLKGLLKNGTTTPVSQDKTGAITETQTDIDSHIETPELRDEANRKWWKLFDEYEYRFNKSTKSKLKTKTRPEKILLIKLHLLITFYSFVGYWVKYLDQQNITNAYVSGMKEELNMVGNDYINAQSFYNAGAVIFQLFFMYLLPRVPLHYLLGFSEVIWGFITLAHYAITDVTHLYALRFLTGAAESGYFILWHYCFSNWFLPDELGFVGGFYYCGQMLGILTSGLIAGHTTQSMEGLRGLSGWRWLFIIDAVITIPVGIIGFYVTPGTPSACYSLFLTDDEIRLARRRLKNANIETTDNKNVEGFFSKSLWTRLLTDWRIYVLTLLDYFFWSSSSTVGGGIAIWLKSTKKFSIPKINRLSSLPPALGIAYILLVNVGADYTHSRLFSIVWAYTFNFIGCVILIVWDVPEAAKWFAFMLGYFNITVSSVIYGWMNDIMRYNAQDRAIVLMFTNLFCQQFRAWVDRLVFPTVESPEYRKGYSFAAANTVATVVMAFVTLVFYKRQERKDARKNGIIIYDSSKEISAEVAELLQSEDYTEEESNQSH